jgi:hypothetical protein
VQHGAFQHDVAAVLLGDRQDLTGLADLNSKNSKRRTDHRSEVAWIRERCTGVATAAAVLRLNNHVHVAAIGQSPCEGHSTMLGLVAGQPALPIGHDPIATHTLNYINILDWHRPAPFLGLLRIYSPGSARPSTVERGPHMAQYGGRPAPLSVPGHSLLLLDALRD